MDAGRRQLAAGFPRHLAERARAEFCSDRHARLEPVDALPGFRGQVVIGIVHVDVLRVAALLGSSTANSVVALGGRGWLEWSVWNVSPGMMRLPFSIWSLET